MAYDPMEGFQIGQAIGKGKKSSLSRTSDYMSDLFKTRDAQDTKSDSGINKIYQAAIIKSALQQPLQESQIALNEAKTQSELKGKTGRKTAILNTRTGKAFEPGTMRELTPDEISSGEWLMRNQQFPPQGGITAANSAESSIKQIDDLKNLITTHKNNPMFKAIGEKAPALGDKEVQRYNIIRKDFSDRLLRLRSGAQINESEYKRLMGMLPQFWRSSDVDIEQLDKFKNEYQSLINKISSGSLDINSQETNIDNQTQEDPKERLRKKLLAKGLL